MIASDHARPNLGGKKPCFDRTVLQYATYFDRHYLLQGLALYRSLLQHSPPFTLWVLCFDEETEQTLARLDLGSMRLIALSDLERADPALLSVKGERQPVEYYWTCGPAFLLEILRSEPEIELLTYLDADLFCFGDPVPVFQGLGSRSVLVVEHRYSPLDQLKSSGGKYNVGVVVFRRTDVGLACLQRWREQCLDWCFDRFECNRYGDQHYLDEWPERFNAAVLRHAGAGLAPWNLDVQPIEHKEGRTLVEGLPVIFFHFARVRRRARCLYELHEYRFHRRALAPVVRRHIYAPYVRELYQAEGRIRRAGGQVYSLAARAKTAGEALRKSRIAGIPWTQLTQYRRFMWVLGRFTF